MLFLLNECVIDIGEPYSTFLATRNDKTVRANLANGIRAGQKIVFAKGGFAGSSEEALQSVASEIACSSIANAALFVCHPRARGPQDVGVRLAETPITTLAFLYQQQMINGPSLGRANVTVWRLAAQPAA